MVPAPPHLIHCAGIAAEPSEHLLTDRGVHAAQSWGKASIAMWFALAMVFVFGPVPLIRGPVPDLLKQSPALALWLEGAVTVVYQGIHIAVQSHDLPQTSNLHCVVFWVLLLLKR